MAALTPSTFLGAQQLNRSSFAPRAAVPGLSLSSSREDTNTTSNRRRLVVEAKKRRSLADGYGRKPGPMMSPLAETDDGIPKFVIFIKTKNVSIWYPLTMVNGGTTAQMMVNAMKWDFGKRMYEGTLTKNLASVIYKDERAIQQTAIKQFPMLKGASGYEYGYKMVDPKNPKASVSGSGVIQIPPKEELVSVLDKAKSFFDGLKQNISGGSQEPEGSKK